MMSGAQQHDPQTTTTHNDNNGSGQPQPDAGGSYHPFQNNNISHSDDGSSSNPAVPQWGSFVSHKRKEDSLLTGDGGDYHQHDSMSDGDDDECDGSIAADGSKRRGGAVGGSNKRVLKNAREKERSSRIAKQIDQLRDMLTSFGVVVAKGTKSSVLSEVANYIRLLQQQQFRSEIDRNLLIQQIQLIGSGAHGPDAAAAIRQAAAHNGVWSLGNFDAISGAKSAHSTSSINASGGGDIDVDASAITRVDLADYRCIFNSSGVGMAIASMGGAFMDCNSLFARLSNYSKQELCTLTIFNLTARNDLQRSFDLISHMISPPLDGSDGDQPPPRQIVLRGSMKYRNDLGMSISLVKGDNGIAKCFVVTLVKNPTSPFDASRPIPVSIESIVPEPTALLTMKEAAAASVAASAVAPPSSCFGVNPTHTFTSG